VPRFDCALRIEQASSVYIDWHEDACLLKELSYKTGQATQLLNITEELNEQDFFTVARLDHQQGNTLVVLEFDEKTLVCSFTRGKV
jgi:hypothetical protein